MLAFTNILVPTDFSETSDVALAYGRELARRFGATLYVLHIADNIYLRAVGAETYAAVVPNLQQDVEQEARERLDALLKNGGASEPSTHGLVMTSSSPAFAIIDAAREHAIDLIVMGTHGRGPLAHFVMGSVAERVVREAPCPVLTVRHPQQEAVRSEPRVAAACARD